mmetsp:Transcript_15894/g.31533  ORF Transcript_15894/g.31533 Transcript_15894/m.31533 type:complete len:308 (-) Transcript_15894:963-1886(-)
MSTTKFAKPQRHFSIALLEEHSFVIGLTVRLILMYVLPRLMDDGLLLQGVRYTDIDYDVFTDAAEHIAHGRSPYARHTYRYTPFLAKFLALPLDHKLDGNGFSFHVMSSLLSTKYFGKFLFCIADAICGYIIALLRRRQRASSSSDTQQPSQTQQPLQKQQQKSKQKQQNIILKKIQELIPTPSAKLVDALWWLYNPLPINICTRGSAESLVVLLPVLITVALVNMYQKKNTIIFISNPMLPRDTSNPPPCVSHGHSSRNSYPRQTLPSHLHGIHHGGIRSSGTTADFDDQEITHHKSEGERGGVAS